LSSWHSYPSLFNLGHRAVRDLTNHEVVVQEKVDGSQFSFGLFVTDDGESELRVRSKGAVMLIDAPEKMFTKAAETVKSLRDLLQPNWTYRGEYLAKPKHNSLAYDRVPSGNIILFDINIGDETYLSPEDVRAEAARLGLEAVPELYRGIVTLDQLRTIIDTTISVLGGQKIEGVVLKPVAYDLYGVDKKVLLGKFVSEAFKEIHRKAWGESNPTKKDIMVQIGDALTTPARWNKAIQHLREAGQIEDSPKDIGKIVREVPADILKECEDEIKQKLFDHAWPDIRRMVVRGLPEYYKEQLMKLQFENPQTETVDNAQDTASS
jgi:hypothetical protein